MAIGQHTQSDDVGRGMPSLPLGSTCGQITSGVTCHLHPWSAQTVGQRRAWHAIIALGKHTRSDYVTHAIKDLVQHIWLDEVGRGRPSTPLDNIHRFEQRRAWRAIIDLGQHTRSDDVRSGILSFPLDYTHSWMMLGVEILSSTLGTTLGQRTSSLTCHHRPWKVHSRTTSTWNAIIPFGRHK